MVQVSYPGVYVREIPSGVSTITGVPTSIAVFIGMAKRGPINNPKRVLGYLDYTRVFSADTSLGEMTDQVRQYFQNGGQQAYIVRVANNAKKAELVIASATSNAATITLTATSEGSDGSQLRASVDYNTPNPESTFNLTVYRETIDASGNASVQDLETFKNVSMDAANPRFVKTAINQGSALVSADVEAEVPTTAGYSIGALLGRPIAAGSGYVGSATAEGTLINAIQAVVGAAVGSIGKFKIRVGTGNLVDVTLTTAAGTFNDAGSLGNAIDDAIRVANSATDPITSTSIETVAGVAYLKIAALEDAADVTIERGSDHDIAQALGLGLAQGGIEVSAFAGHRPAPNGYVSVITSVATNVLDALLTFGGLVKSAFGGLTLTGSQPFSVAPASVVFPVLGTAAFPSLIYGSAEGVGLGTDGVVKTAASLLNIRENLAAIATGINASQTKWRAQVNGYRLALTPVFGSALSGPGHSLNGTAGAGWT
ncbi:MAG TPA: hypothetical protein VIV60_16595, partial [Polyangiaceae bacterium]